MVKILNHEGRQVAPAVHLVLIEETENWCDEIKAKAGRLFGVYLFDRNRRVHACEMTPSYELHFLKTIYTREFPDTPEGERERDALEMEIMLGDAGADPIRYFHTHVIDGLPTISLAKWSAKHYREIRDGFDDEEKLHDEVMGDMIQAEHECESNYWSLIGKMDRRANQSRRT